VFPGHRERLAPTVRWTMGDATNHIGTLREKPLHASLKRWYAEPGDAIEVPLDEFVIDLVRDDLLVEIQTRSFSSMKKKAKTLIDRGHRMIIVHPIAVDRWIVKIDEEGSELSRRKSPRHGAPLDLFSELVAFPKLMQSPNLAIDVLLTHEEEVRHHTPDKAWRRRGWSVLERRLIGVVDLVPLRDVTDLVGLLPPTLPTIFTTADIAAHAQCPRRIAQQAAYCLREMGAITIVGKQGNAIEYSITG